MASDIVRLADMLGSMCTFSSTAATSSAGSALLCDMTADVYTSRLTSSSIAIDLKVMLSKVLLLALLATGYIVSCAK